MSASLSGEPSALAPLAGDFGLHVGARSVGQSHSLPHGALSTRGNGGLPPGWLTFGPPRTPSLHGQGAAASAWHAHGGSGHAHGGSGLASSSSSSGGAPGPSRAVGRGEVLSSKETSLSPEASGVKQWRGSGGESMLVMLCAFDIWLSVLWLYVVVLAIVCTPGIQLIWTSDARPAQAANESGSSSGGAALLARYAPTTALYAPPTTAPSDALATSAATIAASLAAAAVAAAPPPASPASPAPSPLDAANETFIALFGLLFCGASVLVTIALLALFFMREWGASPAAARGL